METEATTNKKKTSHRILKTVLWTVLGLWLLLTVVLQVVLNTRVLTKIADKVASEYVDGDVSFSAVKASMFKSFPNINLTIEDFSLTYPHDRFAKYDSLTTVSSRMLSLGRGEEADTLAHFCDLSLSLNYMKLLTGRIRVGKAFLEHPRIFARQFSSTEADWNMFKVGSSEEKDTTSGSGHIPTISIGKVKLDGKPLIVYINPTDTLSGSIFLKSMTAGGRYESRRKRLEKVSLDLDSLFVAGRLPADTLALALDHFGVKEKGKKLDIDLKSKIFLALRSAGRMQIPFDLSAKVLPDFDKKVYEVENLKATLATLDLKASGKADLSGKDPYLQAQASIDDEPVSEVTEYFGKNFPILQKLKTDARVSLTASCDGYYDSETKSLPKLSAHLQIPDAAIGWKGFDEKGRFDLEANASTTDGKLNVDIPDFCCSIEGLGITLEGSGEDLLCGDPLIKVDGSLHATLDTLMRFVPDSLGIFAHGTLDGKVGGSLKPSQLSFSNFDQLGLTAAVTSNGISFSMPSDTIEAYIGRTDIALGPYSHTETAEEADGHEEGEHHHTGITATIDSIFASVGGTTFIRGTGARFNAHNAEETISPGNHPIHGHLQLASLGMMDIDSCFVGLKNSVNTFKLTRKPQGRNMIPYMDFTTENKSMVLRAEAGRIMAKGLGASISAHPAAEASKVSQARKKHLLDSLQRVYPSIPRDSLFRHAASRRQLPDYMTEKDFAKKDINIQMSESIAGYIRNWALSGRVKLAEADIATPYLPLPNKVQDFDGKITNNEIDLSSLRFMSGSSDISASGTLTGLKRALTSKHGKLKLDLDINSDLIDANELLSAIGSGKKFSEEGDLTALNSSSDSDYLEAVQSTAETDSTASSLIVLPSNLEAKVNLNANTIRYSDLETSWVSSSIDMKERCLQLTNTLAMTNMGDVYLEGFYSTRTKKDLKAGFDLTLSNITAEKVIHLFPAVDSIMPMLKAFKGLLDCEMAATASIDTSMNIILPSISGIIKVDGKNLSLAESKELDKLRRTLMFKDRDSSVIDDMSVRGIIKDDHLEVFPFILKVDRYTIALNGLQKFDQNFKYHVSAIHSPIPFRFGINLKGSFSDWKWSLGKAKFKSTQVPLFDDQVDGLRYNLLNAIHNIFDRGVEQALKQNAEAQAAIETKKSEMAYNAEDDGEALSEEEKKQLEAASAETEEASGQAGN